MKGWYGKRQQHSLASKGIRMKARGTEIGVVLFPSSYQTFDFDVLEIKFDEDGNDILYIGTEELVQKIYDLAKAHDLKVRDRDGDIVPLEPPNIRMMMLLNPEGILDLSQYVFQRDVYSWSSVESTSKVTEYYPSLVGKEVELEFKPFKGQKGNRIGTVIDERIEKSDKSDYGDDTIYKIELEDGTIMENIMLRDIEEIEGKKPKDLMVFKEKEKIMKFSEEDL